MPEIELAGYAPQQVCCGQDDDAVDQDRVLGTVAVYGFGQHLSSSPGLDDVVGDDEPEDGQEADVGRAGCYDDDSTRWYSGVSCSHDSCFAIARACWLASWK